MTNQTPEYSISISPISSEDSDKDLCLARILQIAGATGMRFTCLLFVK